MTDKDWSHNGPIRTLAWDIECRSLTGRFPKPDWGFTNNKGERGDPIIQIGCHLNIHGCPGNLSQLGVIFTVDTCLTVEGYQILCYETEKMLLEAWFEFLLECDADCDLTYNGNTFDTSYTISRASVIGAKGWDQLSRFIPEPSALKTSTLSSNAYGTRTSVTLVCCGRISIDIMEEIMKSHKLREYGLGAVCAHFLYKLNLNKEDLPHEKIGPYQLMSAFFRAIIASYCGQDALLLLYLMKHLEVLVNLVEMSRATGVTLHQLLTRGQQIKVLSLILRIIRKAGYLFPFYKATQSQAENHFEGATVLQPLSNYYKIPVITLDFNSLYPSIIQRYNLCHSTILLPEHANNPEKYGLREEDIERNNVTGQPLAFLKKSKLPGILPEILASLLSARKAAKIDMENAADGSNEQALFNGRQLALKVSANCFPQEDHEILTVHGFYSLGDVLKHFESHKHLGIACSVNGELQYHDITADNVIQHTGDHNMVEFDGGRNGVSIQTTENHRMWARVGVTYTNRIWRQKTGQSQEEAAPDFKIHLASEVVAAGKQDVTSVVQFEARFPQGIKFQQQPNTLPFVIALGLSSEDQVNAFLELYGYWLGNGSLDSTCKALTFSPTKVADSVYLDALFTRLNFVRLTNITRGPGVDGVYVAPPPEQVQRKHYAAYVKGHNHYIYSSRWWVYFSEQYGHTQTTYVDEEICTESSVSLPRNHENTDELVATGERCSSPEPLSSENIDSAKWFWHWTFSHLQVPHLRAILVGLRMADGDMATQNRADGSGLIYTSSQRFRDEIIRVATHAGYTSFVAPRVKPGESRGFNKQGVEFIAKHQAWSVSFSDYTRQTLPKLTIVDEVKSGIAYSGTVWCVNVPVAPNLIFVRRILDVNGVKVPSRPVVIGNSVYGFCGPLYTQISVMHVLISSEPIIVCVVILVLPWLLCVSGAVVGMLPKIEISSSTTGYGRGMIMKSKQIVEEHFTIKNGQNKHTHEPANSDFAPICYSLTYILLCYVCVLCFGRI